MPAHQHPLYANLDAFQFDQPRTTRTFQQRLKKAQAQRETATFDCVRP